MDQPENPQTPVEIVDNLQRDRFELWRLGEGEHRDLIGFLAYRLISPEAVELQHTVIAERFSRQGYARLLTTTLLERLAARGASIVPTCTYVQDYLERFPEHRDLVVEAPEEA